MPGIEKVFNKSKTMPVTMNGGHKVLCFEDTLSLKSS